MNCNRCGKKHDGSFGSGLFCSRSCANTRTVTDEHKRKTSESLKGRPTQYAGKQFPDEVLDKFRQTHKQNAINRIMSVEFDTLSVDMKRKRVLHEQLNGCARCGIKEWNGIPIILEMDHIDGNTNNNDRNNLECLCPNCHSQTTTWRGRNKTKRLKPVTSDVEICEAFIKTGNIRQCLLSLGLAAKGSNYGRVKRALTLNGIEY